jgi:hypothetical protein
MSAITTKPIASTVAIQPIAFSVADAVAYSGLSRSRLYELMKAQEVASFQVGGRRMILREAIDRFISDMARAA